MSRVPYIHVVPYVLLHGQDRLLIEQKAIRNNKKNQMHARKTGERRSKDDVYPAEVEGRQHDGVSTKLIPVINF